jgi:hypothetical protein
VDELKRENQKLLQIISQLQCATLSTGGTAVLSPVVSASLAAAAAAAAGGAGGDAAAAATAATTPCLSGGVQPDSVDSGGPSVAAAAAGGAGHGGGGSSSVVSGQRGEEGLVTRSGGHALPPQSPRQQQQRLLAPLHSWPVAATPGADNAAQSGSWAVSQPGNTSAGISSCQTLQLLPGCHSAPHALAALQRAAAATSSSGRAGAGGDSQALLLLRTCGCAGDDECEECEGVRVTLSSCSSLPLVTTPGPRPKPLSLEDLLGALS